MTIILWIGVVTALAVLAILAKAYLSKPTKAQKWEKAQIMKQLLALSEGESSPAAVAASRSRKPLPKPGMRKVEFPLKPATRTSQPVPSNKARC